MLKQNKNNEKCLDFFSRGIYYNSMSLHILDRIRKLNRMVEMYPADDALAREISAALADEFGGIVKLMDKEGKVLLSHKSIMADGEIEMIPKGEGDSISSTLNERLLGVMSTDDNASLELLGLHSEAPVCLMVVPVTSNLARVATLLIYRNKKKYELDDIIYVEHAKSLLATIFGGISLEKDRDKDRAKTSLNKGIYSLSNAELTAASYVLDCLDQDEGIVVAKDVSESKGVSRSVIVAALKKLESAGVIECRSAGSKGTYIKIANDFLRDSIDTLVQKN